MLTEGSSPQTVRHYQRFTLNQRIQHAVLIASMTLLIVTGMPVRYYQISLARQLVDLMGGMETRALLHRIGAVTLIALCIYHAAYTLFSRRGREEFVALIPWINDARDFFQLMLYYLGFSKHPPRYGRYSFIEKFEYLAVAWGGTVMILTGFVMWFPSQSMRYLPKWAVDVARVAHSYEALLAFLAIIIWHFYCVHLNPDFFPMNPAFLTGKLTEEQMAHHHPLEYDKVRDKPQLWTTVTVLQRAPAPQPVAAATFTPLARLGRPVARALAILSYGGVGAAMGIVAPLMAYVPFALVAWMLNPKGNFWGVSLMPVYILLSPSMLLGCISGAADAARRRPFGPALYGSLAACMGFCIGPILVWLPAASLWHLLRWVSPQTAASRAVMEAGFWVVTALSLVVGLAIAVWARRQGAKVGEWMG
ncbi:MAG: formate dehydrogenase subunit gamma [Armatimonadota bacterium]